MLPIPYCTINVQFACAKTSEMWNLIVTLRYADRHNAENAKSEFSRTVSHRNICVITLCSVVQSVIQQLEERLSDFIKHHATKLNFMVRFI